MSFNFFGVTVFEADQEESDQNEEADQNET